MIAPWSFDGFAVASVTTAWAEGAGASRVSAEAKGVEGTSADAAVEREPMLRTTTTPMTATKPIPSPIAIGTTGRLRAGAAVALVVLTPAVVVAWGDTVAETD